jgi:hypothetical protein
MNWIYLAQESDTIWVLVNTVMNLLVPYKMENVFTTRVTAFHGIGSQLHCLSPIEAIRLFQIVESVLGQKRARHNSFKSAFQTVECNLPGVFCIEE